MAIFTRLRPTGFLARLGHNRHRLGALFFVHAQLHHRVVFFAELGQLRFLLIRHRRHELFAGFANDFHAFFSRFRTGQLLAGIFPGLLHLRPLLFAHITKRATAASATFPLALFTLALFALLCRRLGAKSGTTCRHRTELLTLLLGQDRFLDLHEGFVHHLVADSLVVGLFPLGIRLGQDRLDLIALRVGQFQTFEASHPAIPRRPLRPDAARLGGIVLGGIGSVRHARHHRQRRHKKACRQNHFSVSHRLSPVE